MHFVLQVYLPMRHGTSGGDAAGRGWDEYELETPIYAMDMTLTLLTCHINHLRPGYREVEVFADSRMYRKVNGRFVPGHLVVNIIVPEVLDHNVQSLSFRNVLH